MLSRRSFFGRVASAAVAPAAIAALPAVPAAPAATAVEAPLGGSTNVIVTVFPSALSDDAIAAVMRGLPAAIGANAPGLRAAILQAIEMRGKAS